MDFFRLFGRTLYTDEVGISCRDGGAFYSKIDAGLDQPGRPFMMSVEDPADPSNDLCRGSWNILKVIDLLHLLGPRISSLKIKVCAVCHISLQVHLLEHHLAAVTMTVSCHLLAAVSARLKLPIPAAVVNND